MSDIAFGVTGRGSESGRRPEPPAVRVSAPWRTRRRTISGRSAATAKSSGVVQSSPKPTRASAPAPGHRMIGSDGSGQFTCAVCRRRLPRFAGIDCSSHVMDRRWVNPFDDGARKRLGCIREEGTAASGDRERDSRKNNDVSYGSSRQSYQTRRGPRRLDPRTSTAVVRNSLRGSFRAVTRAVRCAPLRRPRSSSPTRAHRWIPPRRPCR